MKLTLPQQDVYFEQLLYPNEPIYNIGAKIAITGPLSVDLMRKAYLALIDQHDAYRCIITGTQDQVDIDVVDNHNSKLKYLDFSRKKNADEYALDFMQDNFTIPFDLNARELLHQFILIKISDDFHYLYSVYHHIITDGWGTSLMFQRFVKNYNELSEFGEIQTEYPYSYLDFAEDDAAYSCSEDFLEAKEYWVEKFEKLPERFLEKIDETKNINKSSRKELVIKRADYNLLGLKAKECKVSTFNMILGVLFLYFSRKHQNNDFAIGLPVLNRGKSVFKKTVGLFMGVSALRMEIDSDSTFEEFVQQIRQQLRQDYRHQRFPLGKIIKELNAFYEKDRLFNITLSYERQNYSDHFQNTTTKVIPLSHESERVALAVYIREFDEQEDVKVDLDYNLNYFTEESITQLSSHLNHLIAQVTQDTDVKIKDFSYLSEAEERQIITNFNKTKVDLPKRSNLLSLFNKQSEKDSSKVAISDQELSYTYHKVDVLSDRVANYLNLYLSDDEKSPVAVLMNRSVDLIVILLGVLKSGRAFIPLDPGFPEERIKHIIDHSEVTCVIADDIYGDINTSVDAYLKSRVMISTDLPVEEGLANTIKPSDTAYIIYTSGSTGKPKGVEISHGSLANFLLSMQKKPGINVDDLLFSVTTQSFDISILEFFAPLISGASIYIANKDLLNSPMDILNKIEEVNPTVMQATPSFYQMLFNANWTGNKKMRILCGGDLLSKSLAEKLIANSAKVWNMYGPTETTIWSSIKEVKEPSDASNIGKPINNTSFYVLDNYLKPLPVGSVGNIYIGGKGLAKGYYKNNDLTKEKFVGNPFRKSGKIYETGDLGKWNAKGEIEFLGRNDNQVKIRGYRIELGEIETKLNQLEVVESSVVVARKKKNQEAWLMAFVVLKNKNADLSLMLELLRKELPGYMIPYSIIPMKSFPLTPNNKIDRKSLMLHSVERRVTPTILKRPKTEVEEMLSTFYKEVLELNNPVEMSSNFFSLGGHSLNAVKLISLVSKNLGYQLSLRHVFEYPTVYAMASFLETKKPNNFFKLDLVEEQDYYPVSSAQYAIWLAAQQREKSIAYNMPAAFEIEGELKLDVLELAFTKLIEKYEILRTNFVEVKGQPQQKILDSSNVKFEISKSTFTEDSFQEGIQKYLEKEFDLENHLLVKLGYFQSDRNTSCLVFCTHHIIMDGWSLEVLINELVQTYQLLISGVEVGNKNLNFQFKDYLGWQDKIEKENAKANEEFWSDYLNGYQWNKTSFVPKSKSKDDHHSANYNFTWSEDQYKKLNQVAQQSEVSLHTLLVASFNLLLFKNYNNKDVCIGTVNSGRGIGDLDNQLGMFVKTLPLRTKINNDDSVLELIQQTHQNLLKIDQYQDVPRTIQRTTRLDVLFAMQNHKFNYERVELDEDLDLHSIPIKPNYSRIPLLVNFSIVNDCLQGKINFSLNYFDEETIEFLMLKYEALLNKIINNSEVLIDDLDINLSLENKKVVEIGFNF